MSSKLVVIFYLVTLFVCSPAAWGAACLDPSGPVTASVEQLGPNPGGLEQLRVHVEGFDLAPLASYGVGCTVGLGLEAQITGPPLWAIQKRAFTSAVKVIDPLTGGQSPDFVLNAPLHTDFNGEAIGLGYVSWPVPIWLTPFSTPNGGSLPAGPVELVFDLLVKPGYSVQEVLDDLEGFGHVASDFSVDYGGVTYLLWSSVPFMTKLDSVSLQ